MSKRFDEFIAEVGSMARSVRRWRVVVALAVSLVLLAPAAANARPVYPYPFRDPHLSLATRIADLLSRLTLGEKVSLLHQYEPAIPRLGIPGFKTGTEALHGVAWSTDVNDNGAVVTADGTVFPQAVGLASTWDPALIKQVGNAVGQEARGFNVENPSVWGLNLWAPVVNLLRDPRWGRNEEGYSEDPYLTSRIATAYGSGIEGGNPTYLQAAPTLKHYLAYNNETDRETSDSVVPPAILHDYDQQAFQSTIAANAATGVMASYNLVNGRPNTVDPDLATTERGWTDKTLMNVTDASGPNNLVNPESYYGNQAEADAAAIKAGIDSFTTDDTNSSITINAVEQALSQKLLTPADIDRADTGILSIRFRLGDFDPPGSNPYASITPAVIDSPAHQALARQAADEQMVLLHNQNNALPLNAANTKKIAVVGPLENTLYTDWYSGALPYAVTPLQGITQRLGTNGSVASSEGVDRIALQDTATGKYLTASTATAGAPLTEAGTTAGPNQSLDVFDWGAGIVTLRTVANNRYLTLGTNHALVNSETQPNGWFVQQQFSLVAQPDGSDVLEYSGNDATQSWFGNRYAVVGSDGTVTIGAATPATATHFRENVVTSGVDSAVAAAKGASAAVVVVGSMPFINGREADDRTSTALPSAQEALIEAVRKANPNTIVVLENSYPDTIDWAQANVPAILHTTHAGQETGHAVADVLFGDYNPSGRLTQTWYASDADLPSIQDYDIAKSGMTYQYYQGSPLYPFGYGLSYTSFRYSNLRLSTPSVNADGTVRATVEVTNTGSAEGTDTVQLYSRELRSRASGQPQEELRDFARVTLKPHQTRTVTLTLNAADLKFWDVTRGRYVVESGQYQVRIGHDADNITLSAPLTVHGQTIPPRDLTAPTQAQNFDDYSGVTLTDQSKADGTSVASTAGGWISFADTTLPAGVRGLTAQVANEGSSAVHVALRLDDPATGPTIGTLTIPSTGGHYDYSTVTTALAGIPAGTGPRTVYLVFDGAAELFTFRLTG
jgi:beta-glucosidase